jgi:hypothetical protein
VATLSFQDARQCVLERICAAVAVGEVPLDDACGRVLADPVDADRDYPATARSIRDGFAVRSEDTPGRLRVTGEVAAGAAFGGEVQRGEAVEIMTGAPVPRGADAVVMVEHVTRDGEFIAAPAAPHAQFVNPQASEARAGAQLLAPGRRMGYAEIALLATAAGLAIAWLYHWKTTDLVWSLWLCSLVLGYLTLLSSAAGGAVVVFYAARHPDTKPGQRFPIVLVALVGGLLMLAFFSFHFSFSKPTLISCRLFKTNR